MKAMDPWAPEKPSYFCCTQNLIFYWDCSCINISKRSAFLGSITLLHIHGAQLVFKIRGDVQIPSEKI